MRISASETMEKIVRIKYFFLLKNDDIFNLKRILFNPFAQKGQLLALRKKAESLLKNINRKTQKSSINLISAAFPHLCTIHIDKCRVSPP